MSTIKQLVELDNNRLTPSTKKLDSTLIDIDNTSIIRSGENGLTIDTSTIDNKVDKVVGKGLSDENFTIEEKQKLANLESSKFLGVYTSFGELSTAHSTAIPGNYADVDTEGADVRRYIWDDTDSKWVLLAGSGSGGGDIEIVDSLDSNDAFKALSARQGKVLNDNKQDKGVEVQPTEVKAEMINSIPLYTLNATGAYVLCEPDMYIKFGDFYLPAYTKTTLGID